MKKNAGVLTALAVVLAFFGLSNFPKSSPGGAAIAEPEAQTKPRPKTTTQTGPFPPCAQIKTQLQPLMAEYPDPDWGLPGACFPDHKGGSKSTPEHVSFAIATAPNPVSTHLSLLFDRFLEIVMQAAEDDNYLYEGSWLPWNESKDYSRFPDLQAAEAAKAVDEAQPGVLIFRHSPDARNDPYYRGGLAVFVVSESPTGGIDQVQFENALAWIDQLGGIAQARELKILGPTHYKRAPLLE
jgi:hypothetical protein